MNYEIKYKSPLLAWFLFFSITTFAQCPNPVLYDGGFTPTTNPVWLNCINLASSPDSFQVAFGSPADITNYSIDFGDGSPILNGSNWGAGSYIYHIYQNLGTYSVSLTETNNGCPVTITGSVINERTPTAGIVGPPVGQNSGCAPHSVCFGNSSYNVTESTVFTWDFGDGTSRTFDYTNAGQTVCHTYDESAAACGIVVSLTATNNCGTSTTTWNPVDIFKPDVARITPANSMLCYPDTTVTFTNTSILNCISGARLIYWDFGDGTTYGWTSINTPITHSFPGVGSYTVMMVDSNACGADTAYANVTIVNKPIADVSALEDTICVGQSIAFSNNSTGGGNQFTWDFDDGTVYTVGNTSNQTHTFNNQGNYSVSLLTNITGASGSCSDIASVNVVVLSGPTADFSIDNNQACDSLTVNITEQTSGASSWVWDFGNGNTSVDQNPPSQFYNSQGQYSISLSTTSNNGCTNYFNRLVIINESPQAQFNVAQACIGDTAKFIDISTFSADSIISWNWNFGDGTSSNNQNPNHIYSVAGNQNVTLNVSTQFCSNQRSSTITIDSLPDANFVADNFEGCSDLIVNFTNTSSGAINYSWSVDGIQISNAEDFNYTFSNTHFFQDSVFVVDLVSETAFGCKDDTSINVIVHPLPRASFSSDATPQCSPMEVDFTNASINYINSSWNFDGMDSDSISNPTYTFVNDSIFIENYTVELVVESQYGCRDSSTETVTVYPKPNFDFQADSGCSPLELNLNSNSGAVIYSWDFGDGDFATGQSTSHTFTSGPGFSDESYDIQLIATTSFSCSDTITKTVVAYSLPKAKFVIAPNIQAYPHATIGFNNLSQNASSYVWDLGDTIIYNVEEPDSFTFSSEGTFIVKLTASNNFCEDTATKIAEVETAAPIADFHLEAEGCRPVIINAENNSIYADEYYWDFGDGGSSTQENPSYTYYNPGTYTVSLFTSSKGGEDHIIKKDVIVVHEIPEASFTANPKLVHLPNESVNFYNLSVNATEYYWDFGDGNTSFEEYPEYTYKDLGEFEVMLIASNEFGCADTTYKYIETIAGGKIVIPNAFTPNPLGGNGGSIYSSGMNDVFYPITEGVISFNMKIFSRWGELLFESNNHQIGWDGYYKGEICKQDVYVYQLNVKFENGETVQKMGDITLLR